MRFPTLLGLSYDSNLAPSLAALQKRLRLSEEGLRKVVMRLPQVLSYSYEANLAPKIQFLEEELELSTRALGEKVLAQPALLSCSLEHRYRPRLARCKAAGKPVRLVIDRVTLADDSFERLMKVS